MRVEVGPGTETSPGPVEEVLAGRVRVNVPPVVVGVVLGPVSVHQALHVDHRVGQGVVHLLPEDDAAAHGVGEGGHGRDEAGDVDLLYVGADPAGGDGRLVNDHTTAQHALRAKQAEGGVHECPRHLLSPAQVSELPGQIPDLVLVHRARGCGRAGGLVHVERVEVAAGLSAGNILQVVSGGDGILVDVEAAGHVVQTIEFHVQNCRVEW